jgi:hypothetical protein
VAAGKGKGEGEGKEKKGKGAAAGKGKGDGEGKVATLGWWQRLLHSGTVVQRVMMTGAKWETGPFVQGVREGLGAGVDRCMIDSAMEAESLHTCKTAVVATLCSVRPVVPFVFRNYQLPPGVSSCFPGRSARLRRPGVECAEAKASASVSEASASVSKKAKASASVSTRRRSALRTLGLEAECA